MQMQNENVIKKAEILAQAMRTKDVQLLKVKRDSLIRILRSTNDPVEQGLIKRQIADLEEDMCST